MIDAFVIPAYQFVIPTKPVLSEACSERSRMSRRSENPSLIKNRKSPLLFPKISTIMLKTADL